MAKLTKLKSVVKKWNSFGNKSETRGSSTAEDVESSPLHTVFVGKSRRRYLLTSNIVQHPLIRELSERCGSGSGGASTPESVTVGCEVVLFEHLLWMLENAEPPPESLDELVEFYSC